MTEPATSEHTNRWLLLTALWSAGALFDASQTVLIMHAEGRHHPWLPLFANRDGVLAAVGAGYSAHQ